MKKIISLIIALCLIISVLPSSVFAEKSDTDVTYPVTGGNIYFDKATGTITDCDDSVTTVIIPKTIDGVAVTSIGDAAFVYCYSLTSISIPDSVTSIGDGAFYDCEKMIAINVDADNPNYRSIDGALYNKDATELLAVPGSITDFKFPEGVTSIGYAAFCGCSSLASISIPSSVTSIGDYAFEGCQSLASISIPVGVTSIGVEAFAICRSLASISIPDSVTSIGHEAFYDCGSLTTIELPDSVTSIGGFAFSDCGSLTSISIPVGVTSIGDYAFFWCTSLTDVYYTGNETQWKAINIGTENESLTNATIHYNSTGASAISLGDLNNDGSISNADLVILARAIVELVTLTPAQITAADLSGDGNVSNADLVALARILVA